MRKELSPWKLAALSLFGAILIFMLYAVLSFQSGYWDMLWSSTTSVSFFLGMAGVYLFRALHSRKVNDSQTLSELGSWEKALFCYDIGLLFVVVTLIVGPNFSNWKYIS